MKKLKTFGQICGGALPMLLLWCIGAFLSGSTYMEMMMGISPASDIVKYHIISAAAVVIMPVLLLIFAILGKRFNLKALYLSAVICFALPLVSYILSHIFSSDSSILSWIFGFTLGLLLYPFGMLAFATLEGASSFIFDYTEMVFFDDDKICIFLVVAAIISALLFAVIKTKKKYLKTEEIPGTDTEKT